MVAIPFRMDAGIPGDINRSHPVSVESAINDGTSPATLYGQPVIATSSNTVRMVASTDTAVTHIHGIVARPYPFSQQTTSQPFGAVGFGAGAPPVNRAIDVVRMGYISAKLNTGVAQKGGAVFIWVAATSGAHIQGGFEVAASGGNTCALDESYSFNGPADANGNVEISIAP